MDEYSLYQSHEWRGSWWLPAKPEEHPDKKAGTLRFSPEEGLALRLHGSLSNDFGRRTVVPIPFVHGEASGQLVTLQNCITTQSKYGMGASGMDARESTMWASRAFFGVHVDSPDEIAIERVFANIQHLSSWMWTSSFDIRRDSEARTYTVEMRTPDSVSVDLPDGAKIGIVYSTVGPNWNIYEGEVTAKVTPRMTYEANELVELDEALTEARRFQHFLTLATGKPCSITSFQVVLGEQDPQEESHWYDRLIWMVFQPRQGIGSGKPLHPSDMVFAYKDIAGDFEDYLRNWYSADEAMRVIQNLYFSTRYDSDMFIDTRFMYLVQALESYHRLRFESRAMDEEQYRSQVSRLVQDLPDDEFKQLALRSLGFGNRKSLFERLVELANLYGRVLSGTHGAGRDGFLRRVTKTRHYRTHFDPNDRKDILEGPELVQAYRLLRVMMEVCFLVEMGMDRDAAQKLMAERAEYFV